MNILNHRENSVYLDFGNGIEMSTIWGYSSYSENHDGNKEGVLLGKPSGIAMIDKFQTRYDSSTVEMMFTEAPEDFLETVYAKYGVGISDDEKRGPYGYLPLADWLEIVDMARKYEKSA